LWSENQKGRDHTEDIGVDNTILEWILGKRGGKVWTGFIWLIIWTIEWYALVNMLMNLQVS
jgi:hypothetical protein